MSNTNYATRSDAMSVNLPRAYVECREWGHAWTSYTVTPEGGRYVVELRCVRCDTHRDSFLTVDGRRARGPRYRYPSDYAAPGEQLHTADGRAAVRATLLAHQLNGDTA